MLNIELDLNLDLDQDLDLDLGLDLELDNFEIWPKKFLRPKIQVFWGQEPFRGGLEPFSGLRNRDLKISIFAIIFFFFPRKLLFLTMEIKF